MRVFCTALVPDRIVIIEYGDAGFDAGFDALRARGGGVDGVTVRVAKLDLGLS